jgi:uncharacterized protein (TIGR02145 family)
MRRFRLIFAVLTLLFTSNSFGQALITKDDSISINQDTIVKFIVPEYRGILQWQKSLDGENWIDLEGENSDTLQIDSKAESLYRAQVVDGTCLTVYSDSAIIISTDTLSTHFMAPADSGLVLISDSVNLSEGIYRYFIDTTQFSGINVGTVIIDEETGGSIRRVTNVVHSGDTVTAETNQATMEDLFFDTSFKLSTDMVKPSVDLKSATMEEIEEALTDEEGFIHPVEMVIHTKTGKKLKSALVPQDEGGGTFGDNLYMYEDFTGRDLFYYSNGEDLSEKKYDKDGNINDNYTYHDTADVRFYIQEGYFEFNPVFKFEFDFEAPNFNWRNLNFNKGELKRFKFYSDESSVDFKCIVAVDASYEMTFEKFKKIKDDLIKASFKFLVEGVPVWIDVNVDIFSRFNSELQAELYASAGFQSKHTITVGAGYESGGWYDIYEYTPENTIFPLQYKGHANLSQRFELYPRVDVKIYSFFGPNLEIIPFLEDGLNVTLAGNRNDWIDLGLDIRAGCDVGILGKTLYDYQSDNINLFRINLYNAPDNLEIISGNNQTAPENSKLPNPIVLEVRDNLNFPLHLIPVYFETADGTTDNNKIFSDSEGRVSVNWILDNTSGSKQLIAYCRDGNDNVLESSIITINTQATQTISTPTIVTKEATDLTENSATFNGVVVSDGGTTITERGFYWSETDQTPDSNDKKEIVSGTTGSYNKTIYGLHSNTTYYYQAFATNSQGTNTGESISFSTSQEITIPTVFTKAITDILQTAAFSGGNVTSDGNSEVTGRGVCWSTTTNPTISDNKTTDGTGTGSYNSHMTGLTANTHYFVRAYATNSQGTAYGDTVSFTTNPIELAIELTEPLENITVNQGENVTITWTGSGESAQMVGLRRDEDNAWDNGTGETGITTSQPISGTYSWNTEGVPAGTYYIGGEITSTTDYSYDYAPGTVTIEEQGTIETGEFTDTRDDKTYKTVKIGNQWWMSENLAYDVSDGCWAYNNDESNVATYGRLYTWEAAKNACPSGWHLPTDDEWKQLEMAIGMSQSEADDTGWRGTNEGTKLKDTSGWYNNSFINGNGTDDFGFSALPGGYRTTSLGYFFDISYHGTWWSATVYGSDYAWRRYVNYNNTGVGRNDVNKGNGHSVRCVRD